MYLWVVWQKGKCFLHDFLLHISFYFQQFSDANTTKLNIYEVDIKFLWNTGNWFRTVERGRGWSAFNVIARLVSISVF